MKKLILLFVAAGAGFSAMAQVRGGDNYYAQKYVLDLNFPVGVAMSSPTSNFAPNYLNVATSNIDKIKMGAGLSYGADAQFGYFIGKKRRFGIGAGIQYFMQSSDVTLGAFRVEYQDKDSHGYDYRQVLTATHAIKEQLNTTIINIPVMLKYKQRFTTKLGFTMDAGILYNVQMANAWKTDAEFNYEAIFQFQKDALGADVPVYDKAVTPDQHDWLITVDMYERTHTANTTKFYFDDLHSRGYNVALNVKPNNNSGTINYTTGSIGFMARPAINVRVAKRMHLNLGAYFSYQSFNNKTVDNYKIIDKMGSTYSSMLNTVSTVVNTNVGLNVGLRYFLGEPKDSDFDGMYDE